MKAHENPFSTGRMERVLRFDPELIGESWASIMERWEALGRRAAVVGRHGSGKTTFLDAFFDELGGRVERFFFNQESCQLRDDDRRRMAGGRDAVWLIDGDRHLSWRERRELSRAADRARGVVFARHRACGQPVLLSLKSDPALARVLLKRAAPDQAVQFEPVLTGMLQRRRGNLRHLWLDCYDAMAGG